jgi:hypothetical protein
MNPDKIPKKPMITFTYNYAISGDWTTEEFVGLKEIEICEVKCVKPVSCLERFNTLGLDMEELVTFKY